MPINRDRYTSDYMSEHWDEQLEELENRITAVYANANNQVLKDYTAWASNYEANYNIMLQKLNEGQISEAEFRSWVERRMFDNRLYEQTVKSMTDVLVNSDITAMAMVNNILPLVVSESYNFVQSLGFAAADEAGLSVGTFQVYNARTVNALIKNNPDIMTYVNSEKDYHWNKDRVNTAIKQNILNGDSIKKTADRLKEVSNMDKNGAIRNARTAMTAAENLGRNEGYHDIKEKGVPCRLQWSSTHDGRTRDTHILLDGVFQDDDGYFRAAGVEIRFPGDPEAPDAEIYNCRCRASLRLAGVDHSQDGDMYEKFMRENYPDDWKEVKPVIDEKEAAFREKAEGIEERMQERNNK